MTTLYSDSQEKFDIEDGWDLHRAAKENRVDLAKILIVGGADLAYHDDFGESPLHTATLSNSKDVAEFLINNGADIEAHD